VIVVVSRSRSVGNREVERRRRREFSEDEDYLGIGLILERVILTIEARGERKWTCNSNIRVLKLEEMVETQLWPACLYKAR